MIERSKTPDERLIAEYPGVNGGYPVVAPTRIAVRLVVEAFRETGDLRETIEAFPQLSRDQIQAALDYYRDHPGRVDEDIERNEKALRAIRSR
ncbi:MAG TPA: DUF433 domain-containing protein [Chloroflexota bacterium]|nr:DUF433 domain-containing protein [Chloroflexota bacterium]